MNIDGNAYIILITIVSLAFCVLIIQEIYRKYVVGFKAKKNEITSMKSDNSKVKTLKKISSRPFLLGFENKFLDHNEFYFDDENFYVINKECQKAIFKLNDITEVSKTSIQINNRRLWHLKIKQQETNEDIIFKFAHNNTLWNKNFYLFYEKIQLINPSVIKSNWSLLTM